jgi:hypothetical protein
VWDRVGGDLEDHAVADSVAGDHSGVVEGEVEGDGDWAE